MKNIISKALCGLLSAGMLASCSSDYLDVAPETAVSIETILSSENSAKQALAGLCQSMYFPITNYFEYLGANGEPYIATVYGEVLGQDYFSEYWASSTGGNYLWQANTMPEGWLISIGWGYCYNIINQANVLIEGLESMRGQNENIDNLLAQALTIRAHEYVRLLQCYAPRWQDSNNGAKYALVLRLTSSTDNVPLSTMKEVLDQIYKDCEEAENLFAESGVPRTYKWEPDLSVARGIHCRAALLCEDWQTAQKMAHDARASYSIMTPEEYKAGFCEENREWMWDCVYNEEMGFSAYGTYYACNGVYPGYWGIGAGAINYDLYRKFQEGDIRSDLYFTPDKLTTGRVKEAAFWHEKWIDVTNMNLLNKNPLMKNEVNTYQLTHKPNPDWPEAYTNFQTGSNDNCVVGFGAQYKFWAFGSYGTSNWCMMRAAEMLLNEAEAAYHNNDMATAKAALEELNAQRLPGYQCNFSGDALLEEIRLQRRLELWGEGFSWFDLKRWNLPMIRREWIANDPSSNNVPKIYSMSKQADDPGWRFPVPMSESRYNTAVDRSLLDN